MSDPANDSSSISQKRKKLWEPSAERRAQTHLAAYCRYLAAQPSVGPFGDYESLHAWSIAHPGAFWQSIAAFCGVRWIKEPEQSWVAPPEGKMLGVEWFPGAQLNFAENLLDPRLVDAGGVVADSNEVLVGHAEGSARHALSRKQLRAEVQRVANGLRAAGVRPGDRVAGVLSNTPEAIVAMLATASVGAVWASCSPDFGADAIFDRLGQIDPKVVFYTNAYVYNGKLCDCTGVMSACFDKLRKASPGNDLMTVSVDHLKSQSDTSADEWHAFGADIDAPLTFEPRRFSDPLYILFSSGTTGIPKCIVHGVGGTLLQHKKELLLHGDVGPGSRLCYFTTCGWMMWNWMASALAVGATVVTYDGSPSSPDLSVLWKSIQTEQLSHFGTSPKFLSACMNAVSRGELETPRSYFDVGTLKVLFSTGAPLLPEHFEWVYENVAEDLHVASISGGTDIVSCFMGGIPTKPVYSGQIQGPGLGMAVESWDESGQPIVGRKGELICRTPFPSMPVSFWNDPDGKKYRAAYFEHQFSGSSDSDREIWCHGDYIEMTPEGGVIVHGRSDATLNPGGVRIGTAEIYRVVEGYEGVADAVAVGIPIDGDVQVQLYLKLNDMTQLTENWTAALKRHIRDKLTARHVPGKIFAVADIPYTRSGKKVETAVRKALLGEPIGNRSALSNPEALDEFEKLGPQARA